MNTTIIPQITRAVDADRIFVETHRRRAAVFAAIANDLHAQSGMSDLSIAMEYNRNPNQQVVRDLVSAALGFVVSDGSSYPYGSPERIAYVNGRQEWLHCGSELRVTFEATIDGERVKCDVRCRPQAKRRGYDGREPVNKLVLWYGQRSYHRGHGDETRIVESTRNGFSIDTIRNAIVDRMRAMVADVRQRRVASAERDRERSVRRERQRVARDEREAREVREREQRDINRRELDDLRRSAELMLGLDGITINVNHDGAFTVSYHTTTTITDVAEMRRKLQALSDAFAPPAPTIENDPDEDDDNNWRVSV